jgi:hypothetical protein
MPPNTSAISLIDDDDFLYKLDELVASPVGVSELRTPLQPLGSFDRILSGMEKEKTGLLECTHFSHL